MVELKITKLKCVKKQDSISPDEIYIKVDDKLLAGDFKMGRNDKVTPNATHKFTESAVVSVWERDKNSRDDCLGTLKVKADQAGGRLWEKHFNALKKADYHMNYRVTAV